MTHKTKKNRDFEPPVRGAKEYEAEIQKLRDQIEEQQQLLDECVVATGSLGIRWGELPDTIRFFVEDLQAYRDQYSPPG